MAIRSTSDLLGGPAANAICYSGYRTGQSPRDETYPSYDEIHEDLRILQRDWRYLRLYDPSPHAETVLEVIRNEGLPFRVMLGADVAAEESNPNCPWGADYDDETLAKNRVWNDAQIRRLAELANEHPDTVLAVSIGNEASVEWTDHLVPVDRLIEFADHLRERVTQPITFCENYVPWTEKLGPLVERLDFLSIHTYPVWEYTSIEDAIDFSKANYRSVADAYPDKLVVITEAGWTTASNGRGIDPANASEDLQTQYCEALLEWANEEDILTFVFEAFDEPWKGSPHPLEPEKHWGLYRVDRTPKPVVAGLFGGLVD